MQAETQSSQAPGVEQNVVMKTETSTAPIEITPPEQRSATSTTLRPPLARQTSLIRDNRLQLSVGINRKKSPSRLQRMALQLKLSDRLVLTPFKTSTNLTSGLDGDITYPAANEDQASDLPKFDEEFAVSQSDEFFGEGRYGTVKKCKRLIDKRLFAVKEVRSNVSDDFDKSLLENKILTRLNLANNENIVRQIAFFQDPSKQTTMLVMEALNGMTLLETLMDESADPQVDLDEILLNGYQNGAQANNEEETKGPFARANSPSKLNQSPRKGQEEILQRQGSLMRPRRSSIRTPAIMGLKRQLTAIKKTYFEEHEAKPLVSELLIGLQKMHRLGIVHRDLNPGNIFLHFPNLGGHESPTVESAKGPQDSLLEPQTPTMPTPVTNPMEQITRSHLKIIDFNHSRMFNLDDSPFRIRQRRRTIREDQTDEDVWQEMSELPSPQIWRSPPRNDQPSGASFSAQINSAAFQNLKANKDEASSGANEGGEDGEDRMRSYSLMGNAQQSSKPRGNLANANREHGQRFRMFSPKVGTPIYRAPEIFKQGQMYTESVDLWSAGCCIYFMLVGQIPFLEVTQMNELKNAITSGKFVRERPRYKALSPQAKSLIEGLINKDTTKRLTIAQALQHPWLATTTQISDDESSSSSNNGSDSQEQEPTQ